MSEGSKLVSASIIGTDFINVMVGGKVYSIFPPTVHKFAGAGLYLSDFGDEQTVRDVIKSINDADKLAHALSWLIGGDDSLFEALASGTFDELVNAVSEAYSFISTENFMKLSDLARNAASLIAKPK